MSINVVLTSGKNGKRITNKQEKTLIIKGKPEVIKDFFKADKKFNVILTLEEKISGKTGFKFI
ncbi:MULTISPECIES: hypothetical protein [Photorhabdus]|uniref:Uncharacterized protein n=1 Tax=Photorhabdus khanii subsp. guanajuatensis TaxID=2100166 RepID=A0A4R4JWW0_9GAMM|nr:hypothetical protein [Photorhabdus khanii]TDB58596.1 hypothetical protein C5467_09815 [Photorhabdus khanii subsp. guanajuatensis]